MTYRERDEVNAWMDGQGMGFAERKRISVRRERNAERVMWILFVVIIGAALWELRW